MSKTKTYKNSRSNGAGNNNQQPTGASPFDALDKLDVPATGLELHTMQVKSETPAPVMERVLALANGEEEEAPLPGCRQDLVRLVADGTSSAAEVAYMTQPPQPTPAVAPPAVRHRLQAPRLQDSDLLSRAPCGRLHYRYLAEQSGFFLTLLDEDGKIMAFCGGMIRVRLNGHDVVVRQKPEDICPQERFLGKRSVLEPRIVHVRRQDINKTGEVYAEMPEVPIYTAAMLKEAERLCVDGGPRPAGWGILTVQPVSSKRRVGRVRNVVNSEFQLAHSNWAEATDPVRGHVLAVPGHGGSVLKARLSPVAVAMAGEMPTAWNLAVVSCNLFGGMSIDKIPLNLRDDLGDLSKVVKTIVSAYSGDGRDVPARRNY